MTEREREEAIVTIRQYRYVPKVGKYIAKLAFADDPDEEYWMTEKQMDHLLDAFDATPKGYSTKKVQVIGHFYGDRYGWCRVYRAPWQPPTQYDLSDLEDDL